MDYIIENCRVLTPEGNVKPAALTVAKGHIAGLDADGRADTVRVNGAGTLLLPGIVDIHGDAFERQLMPRPGVKFPLDVALLDTDLQMIANGITTGFHGVTHSWEPGLRGGPMASQIIRTIRALRPRFGCDVRVHLRFETYAIDGVGDVIDMIEAGLVDAVAFNDHVPHFQERRDQPAKLQPAAARAGLSVPEFVVLLDRVRERVDAVPGGVRRLAACANADGIPLLSHDDETPAMRRMFHDMGCRIGEFPVDAATAETARDLGDEVVLGAPNILRGASHCGRLTAAEAIADGLCTILASDYYYPSLLQAAFRIAASGTLPFGDAWNLVSATPARALALRDRGEIAPGRRADLILVDDSDPELPRVAATVVAGRPVFLDGSRLGAWAEEPEPARA
ncbi:alpha-D-ribose 1-methylphosphonate 5-triphosphate diphosphatase [Shumkonia mesophila]|uniref:alpha-D-ribose 1-methylphosphonate 5-triphosphate diphosphatase n=1 Tax=Shumkonia mesophila TaxID=2838854 RepID=UPI002934DBAA|nr:alpha-D-ribose 1-methylphosphonate 5-triphosphate diphosphatase [Shumkonia mesophila]